MSFSHRGPVHAGSQLHFLLLQSPFKEQSKALAQEATAFEWVLDANAWRESSTIPTLIVKEQSEPKRDMSSCGHHSFEYFGRKRATTQVADPINKTKCSCYFSCFCGSETGTAMAMVVLSGLLSVLSSIAEAMHGQLRNDSCSSIPVSGTYHAYHGTTAHGTPVNL